MSLSPLAARAEQITITIERYLMQQDHINYDFKGEHPRLKQAVIKAFLTPLFSVHQEDFDQYDSVRFANTKKNVNELYAIAKQNYIDKVNEKYKVKQEENEQRDKERYFSL